MRFCSRFTHFSLTFLLSFGSRFAHFWGTDLKKIADAMTTASGAEMKGVCTEAGMYALRERRVHVNQEDFEMAVTKVMKKDHEANESIKKLFK